MHIYQDELKLARAVMDEGKLEPVAIASLENVQGDQSDAIQTLERRLRASVSEGDRTAVTQLLEPLTGEAKTFYAEAEAIFAAFAASKCDLAEVALEQMSRLRPGLKQLLANSIEGRGR
jgi:hypothetical protein